MFELYSLTHSLSVFPKDGLEWNRKRTDSLVSVCESEENRWCAGEVHTHSLVITQSYPRERERERERERVRERERLREKVEMKAIELARWLLSARRVWTADSES